MRFVVLSDIHIGPEGYYKGILRRVSKDVKIFLDDFVEDMISNVKPDFIVVLGDLINDVNSLVDKQNIDYIVKLLKKVGCPVYYVVGNHDLKNISDVEFLNLLGHGSLYYSFDVGDYHFVVLYSVVLDDQTIVVPEEQVKWLRRNLNETDKQSIVFVHHGLAEHNLHGNPWFEGKPKNCLIANREEVRDVLSESNKVVASFNGHLHWNRYHVHDNIPYFTIQSFTENEDNKGIASEAYAVVDVEDDKISVDVKGNYPKKFLHGV